MNTHHAATRWIPLVLACALGAAPALAQPPWSGEGNGNGKGGAQKHAKADEGGGKDKGGKDKGAKEKGGKDKGGKNGKDGTSSRPVKQGAYFDDHNRQVVRSYYADAGHGGKSCPPGLAKKNNGCMPPGQAKKWQLGAPLPSTVVTYPVPHQILIGLPPVPVGHKYVQVAGDILLVTVGSMMVVDGIQGLMSR